MFGTLIALAISILIYFSGLSAQSLSNMSTLGILLIIVGTVFLFIPTIVIGLAWTPLQHAEQHLTPRISELFRKDFHVRASRMWLMLFPLFSIFIAFDILFLNLFDKTILLLVWIVLLGINVDALNHFVKRIFNYLDPFAVTNMFQNQAQKSVQNEQELDLCHWIDGLSEISVKAIQRHSTSLSAHVNNQIQRLGSLFLESSISISHHQEDAQSKEMGIKDKISFTLFFVLQRIEMMGDKAAEQRLEPVCSGLIADLGKITIASAKCDISLASYPMLFLGRITIKAQKHGLREVGSKAICTLLEVAKRILNDIDITYLELQDPFFTLTAQLTEISREMFRQDKNMNIKVLTQPFFDLKELFTTEKAAAHQDTQPILQNIDRMLAEFTALEAVMRSIPPISLPKGE